MNDLVPRAEKLAALLKERRHTVAVAESSAGGLISAALLAVPGASAYFVGGAVLYTRRSGEALLALPPSAIAGIRPSSEAFALLLANTVRQRCATTWGVAESGVAGPSGNRYGDRAGHACVAVAGPVEMAVALETASVDRAANMRAFAAAALELLEQALSRAPAP